MLKNSNNSLMPIREKADPIGKSCAESVQAIAALLCPI